MGIPQAVASTPRPQRRSRRLATSARLSASRRLAVAGLALAALTGCASNFNAPTNEVYQPAAGVTDRSGSIFAVDALIVTDGAGNGTVVSRLINQQSSDDQLDSYAAADSQGKDITVAPLSTPLALPAAPSAGQSVQVGSTGDLRLSGSNLVAGQFVSLTLTFSDAAPLSIQVPVVDVGTIYTSIPISPVPTEPSDSAATSAG